MPPSGPGSCDVSRRKKRWRFSNIVGQTPCSHGPVAPDNTKMPTTGQIILLYVAIALFAAGGIVSVVRGRRDGAGLRATARACIIAGLAASVGVLVWHAASRGQWVPLGDNFDALIW